MLDPRIERWSTGHFEGSETILSGTAMVDTGQHAFVKSPATKEHKEQA